MKWLTFTLFFSCIAQALFSQVPAFEWGPAQKIKRELPVSQMVASDTGSFFALRVGKNDRDQPEDFQLEVFSNKTLERQANVPLSLPKVEKQEITYESLFWFNHQLWLFASGYHKSVKRNRAYLYPVTTAGIQAESALEVGEIKAIGLQQRGAFRFALSPDSTSLLIAGSEDLETSYSEELSFCILDTSGLLVAVDTLVLPHKRDRFELEELKLGSKGEVLVLGKVSDTERGWSKGNPNFFYTMVVYQPSDGSLKEFKINLPGRSVSSLTMQVAENGDIVVLGYYSNLAVSQREVAGTFFLRLDGNTQALVGRNFQDFTPQLLNKLLNAKQVAKGKEPSDFYFRHIGLLENGRILMVAEQYYKREVCTTDPRTGFVNCNTHYYYNDLLVTEMDSTGSIQWCQPVYKSQYFINDNGPFGSYLLALENNAIWMIFNDHPKNVGEITKRNGLKYMGNPRRAVVRAVTLNQEGKEHRNELTSNIGSNFTFAPQTFLNLSDHEVVVYGKGKKEFAFGRLRFGP